MVSRVTERASIDMKIAEEEEEEEEEEEIEDIWNRLLNPN